MGSWTGFGLWAIVKKLLIQEMKYDKRLQMYSFFAKFARNSLSRLDEVTTQALFCCNNRLKYLIAY